MVDSVHDPDRQARPTPVPLAVLARQLDVAPAEFEVTLDRMAGELQTAAIAVATPWPDGGERRPLTREKEQDLARCCELLARRARQALEACGRPAPRPLADLVGVDAGAGPAAESARLCQSELRQMLGCYVESTAYLVSAITRRYARLGVDYEDLHQEGFVGLLRAIDGYDWRRGVRFATYAKYWIQERVLKAIYDQARTVRLPAWIQKAWSRLRRQSARAGVADADVALAAADIDPELTGERLQRILDSRRAQKSLDEGWQEGESLAVPASLDAPDFESDRQGLRAALDAVLGELSEREAAVVRRRFGLGGGEPETLQQIGSDLGISAERVRQIEASVLGKLRAHGRIQGLRDTLA